MCEVKTTKFFSWHNINHRIFQFIGGLLMERGEDGVWTMSLGRVAWWLAFIPALVIWIKSKGGLSEGISNYDISPNHLTLLLTLAGYNLGKRVLDTVAGVVVTGKKSKRTTKVTVAEEDGPG
jgi:hypothetical protein